MIDFREVKGDTANRNQNTDPEHQTVYGSLGRTQTKLKAFSERKQQALSLFVQDIDCQMRKKGNTATQPVSIPHARKECIKDLCGCSFPIAQITKKAATEGAA